MKRSTFIKNLISLYRASALPMDVITQYQKIYLLQCFVRGFQQSKIVFKENIEVAEGWVESFSEKINDSIIKIEDAFGKDSYVVANIDELAQSPERIQRFEEILGQSGNKFYEVIFKPS
ncbi:hypothetical protein N7E81_02495 [Reichenbachiella carrageenanivorans]|uniref:Uncharacterized protein n=1 Tax=Reichenbachiella carrageenanivorans TaxID=2979869 RepID=A0ABY6D236_9BACT|nr:hypothetical protein [Reichenbachiella carrageenanivorans]UXX79974.1 hypothetical protein N7E81_02495 [Reichenbachiella carrageenanivorans]